MSAIRIHQIAKELGLANKVVIEKAKEIGIEGKSSHSSSLTADEAESLRRYFIRDAIGSSTEQEQVLTRVDGATGEQKTLLESRKGNVIRRRRAGEETNAPVKVRIQESVDQNEVHNQTVSLDSDRANLEAIFETKEPESSASVDNEAAANEENSFPFSESTSGETQSATTAQEVGGPQPIGKYNAEGLQPERTENGPRVLGRIDLDTPKPKAVPSNQQANKPGAKTYREGGLRALSVRGPLVGFTEEDDGLGGKKGSNKKVKKLVEFSRGDLDYSGKFIKKSRGSAKSKRAEDSSDDRLDNSQKQIKRVVKMAGEAITVGDIAHQMSMKVGEIISKLIQMGVMATINQAIDLDTATIIADEFGYSVEFTGFDELSFLDIEGIDDTTKQQARPPVVTVMGHVDHGKTSLLDYIRKTSVTTREHGGITQHIGAYTVETSDNKKITFLDTPGHAAFTTMRARGAQITDLVILVVAADDGVMPQTVEALNHAKAAQVPIIVAVNKMDKPNINPDKVKQQLAEYGLSPEEWGGDTIFSPVSALTGSGIENLLESVLLVAEIKELKANSECRAKGTVIEVRQEVGRGTVATVLVQAGTLKVGDIFIVGSQWGRIRSMNDHTGNKIDTATPSTPVEITGLNGTPMAGDEFIVVQNENQARQVSAVRSHMQKAKDHLASASGPVSLEEFARQATETKVTDLNVIVKADVHGSLEAVKESLTKLATEEVRVKIVHGAVGGINESDVQLAVASKAIIIGFGVRGEPRALSQAESSGIELRFYRIIYELIDDIKAALGGLLKPTIKEKNLGRVEVRQTFTVPKSGTIAGCYVLNGTIKRGSRLRLLRDERVVFEGKMSTLKRFKDDVKEVQSGYECGLAIDGYNDVKVGDVIEVFELEEFARTLQ